jgi:hypothetical protein
MKARIDWSDIKLNRDIRLVFGLVRPREWPRTHDRKPTMTSIDQSTQTAIPEGEPPKVKKPRKPRTKAAPSADGSAAVKKPRKSRGKAGAAPVDAAGLSDVVEKKQRKPRAKKAKEAAGDAVVAAVVDSAVPAATKDIHALLLKGEWSKADRRNLITNPKTGWTIFLNEQRKLRTSKILCDSSKEMSSVWRAMSNEEKAPYNEKSALDHKRYEDQYNALSADEKKLLRNIKKQTKRERKEKNDTISKVLSPFMLYSADKRKLVAEENQNAKVTKVASIIGQMWKAESQEVREAYYARREAMKNAALKEASDKEAAEAAEGVANDTAADILLDKPVGFGFSNAGTLVDARA